MARMTQACRWQAGVRYRNRCGELGVLGDSRYSGVWEGMGEGRRERCIRVSFPTSVSVCLGLCSLNRATAGSSIQALLFKSFRHRSRTSVFELDLTTLSRRLNAAAIGRLRSDATGCKLR